MSRPLQKTKLFFPPARERLVDRPRLLDKLNAIQSPGFQLALISAPAGSGKTTLVVQWLNEQLGWPAGWVSLDERDNRPSLFFAYLVASLQEIIPGAGEAALELAGLPGANLEEIVTRLANDLAEASRQFVLVLDDFHAITNPALHQAINLLVDAQPPQMRLLLLTREDPPLQLARRRASGQLVELRQEDLQFTLSEAVVFLNEYMGLDLAESQVQVLETRTEGWIAGLQLAALSLQRVPDTGRFIQEFSGSHHFILDYLMEEVLAQQPEEVQSFLLETSILERMNADLCAATTGKTILSAQKLLEGLTKANLFVIPLDEERRWYRYHHLFRDLLLARLGEAGADRAGRLYRRASDGYERAGEARLAVEYALKAGDLERAADLIELHLTERWHTVDQEFLFLVNQLPLEVIAGRPQLCLQSAWVSVISGHAERIIPWVEHAERTLSNPDRPAEPGDLANRAFAKVLRAYRADLDNQPVELDASFEQAFAAIPEGNTGLRNSVAVVLGTIHYMEGDFGTAMRYLQDALERDQRVEGTNAVPISVMRMVWVLQAQGRLRQALELLTEHERYIRQRGRRRFYIGGVLNLYLGEILLEWNQLDEAEIQVREGLQLLEDWLVPQALTMGLSTLARLQVAKEDLQAARSTLERAEAMLHQEGFHPVFIYMFERAQVCLWIAEQNHSKLEAFAREANTQVGSKIGFRYEARQIELSRAWIALGNQQEAVDLLSRLASRTGERTGSRVAVLAMLAAALEDQGAALQALDEALRLGEKESYLRTFIEAGPPLRVILRTWIQNSRSIGDEGLLAYARKILAAFDLPVIKAGPKTSPAAELAEPLSPREMEVLLLLAVGLTNQEIAGRLVISIRTVKKHVENIHGKLGVGNRTHAVARARELGLLDR